MLEVVRIDDIVSKSGRVLVEFGINVYRQNLIMLTVVRCTIIQIFYRSPKVFIYLKRFRYLINMVSPIQMTVTSLQNGVIVSKFVVPLISVDLFICLPYPHRSSHVSPPSMGLDAGL